MIFLFSAFHADVWGTVADIAIASATIVTFFLVLRTFKEQRKVTYFQHLKFLDDIKPCFRLYKNGPPGKFFLELIKGAAYKVEIINYSDVQPSPFIPFDKIDSFPLQRTIGILNHDEFYFELNVQIDIYVYFMDQMNNRYQQKIYGGYPDIAINPPVMIDDNGKEIKFLPPQFRQF